MKDLLTRLAAVEVRREDDLDETDRRFCETQDRLYEEAVTFLSDIKARMEAMFATYEGDEDWRKNGYISKREDIYHVETRLADIRKEHVAKVVSHFTNRYKVTISPERIQENLKGQAVTSAAIVAQVYDQLGGTTFAEKAVQEIKDGMARRLGRQDPEIKGTRLTLQHFVWVERSFSGRAELSHQSGDYLRSLAHALQHFETGSLTLGWRYRQFLQDCARYNGDPFRVHEIDAEMVKSIRIYQNGKVEVTFASYELAARFMAQYAKGAAA